MVITPGIDLMLDFTPQSDLPASCDVQVLGAALGGLFRINRKDLLDQFFVARLDLGNAFCFRNAHVATSCNPFAHLETRPPGTGGRAIISSGDQPWLDTQFSGRLADLATRRSPS